METSILNFLPLLIVFVVFYFIVIQPQQKKYKEHDKLLKTLTKGQKIILNSGIIGVIYDISANEQTVKIEISPNVIIEVKKESIGNLVV